MARLGGGGGARQPAAAVHLCLVNRERVDHICLACMHLGVDWAKGIVIVAGSMQGSGGYESVFSSGIVTETGAEVGCVGGLGGLQAWRRCWESHCGWGCWEYEV